MFSTWSFSAMAWMFGSARIFARMAAGSLGMRPGSIPLLRSSHLLSGRLVELRSGREKLLRLLRHPFGCGGADLLGNLHRAEVRAAHRAEVGGLGALCRQRLV